MRVEGLMVLHYGLDWLPWAVRSVLDHVDRFHIAYVARPSHGHAASVPCPETKQQLRDSVSGLPKIIWHDVNFRHEGQHRDWALAQCRSDLALVVDADEVWDGDTLDKFLKFSWDGPQRNSLVSCATPWRSFNWLCRDPMQPVRAVKKTGIGDAYFPLDAGHFWHFGYCVTNEVMSYKTQIHGHKAEWVPNWYADKWLPWPPVKDVHPTGCGPWDPEPFDKRRLPKLLESHPFWNLEVVE